MMQADQSKMFADSEGDRWFERNQACLERCDLARDLPLRMMELYQIKPESVLEVGASNGCRLAAISERYSARTVAVEPSKAAIRDGEQRFPSVKFVQTTADRIDLDETFDLIIVHFVLHWVDRSRLFRTFAELDRLLSGGGHLIIGDFKPDRPLCVGYHHLPEGQAFTYKQDYAASFLASGLYRQVGMLTANHADQRLMAEVDPNDRIAVWLLQKQLAGVHEVAGFSG